MIEKFLDTYELKARIAPGLIVALPVLAAAIYAAPVLTSWPIFAASSVCSLALLYGLSHVVRARGKAIEISLWNHWGGPPSTRLMRHRDIILGAELKSLIRRALVTSLAVRLADPDEEARNPERADKTIADAFRQVRQYLRQHNVDGLWFKHDIEYGFCRNLLGCRVLWAFIALCSTLFAAVYAVRMGAAILNPASAIGFLSLVSALYVGWYILPSATKRIGEGYAESAWMAFVQIATEENVHTAAAR
jgi:hypothetical protein